MSVQFDRVVGYVGTLGVLAVLAAGFSACGGEVMVGEVDAGMGGDMAAGTGGSPSSGGAAAVVDCSEPDAEARVSRNRWLATLNDFGELAGSRWEGSMTNVPLVVLEFSTDQTGSFQVGTPAPPPTEPNAGYLGLGGPFPVGATYPLHGGSFDGSELLLPLAHYSPFDAWCALQPPVPVKGSTCGFTLMPAASCENRTCELSDGRTVSQAWVETGAPLTCVCTSTDCFANVDWSEWPAGQTYKDIENYESLPTLRLTYDAETDSLSGGYFPDGLPPDGRAAEFVRVE
jgi:hypothetical protein